MRRNVAFVVTRAVVLLIAVTVGLLPLVVPSRSAEAQGRPEFVEDELLVRFKPRVSPASQAAAHGQANAQVVREVRGLDVKVVKIPPQALARVLEAYQRNPSVEFVERNPIAYVDPGPNDPTFVSGQASFGQQWSLVNTGQDGGKVDADIDYDQIWDTGINTASPATVAIVDTGIDPQHQDLVPKITESQNWYDGGSTSDVYGHGTHVAGIAAANTDNGVGIAGVCPECKLLNAKVCSDQGSCPHDRIANGVLWSVGCDYRLPDENGNLGACQNPMRAQIINMSLSGTTGSTTLQQAMTRASELGAVMSCAAGNNGNSQVTYPAFYSNCIAVAATTNRDQRASYSTFGPWVDVAAPGSNIYSTLIGNNYGQMSGTSMASPHVAGLAGLLWSRGIAVVYGPPKPDGSVQIDAPKTAPSVRSRIESTADVISGTGRQWANGRINACRAVKNTRSC